jgi:hypothetical protein
VNRSRRDFLRLSAGATLGLSLASPGRSFSSSALPPLPRLNGGINLQPLRRFDPAAGASEPLINPELVDLQLRMVYQLGFEWIRLTISFNRFGPDFLAAIPYVRAARALGIQVVGVIGQFTGFDLVQALSQPETREEVLEVYLTLFDDTVAPASSAIGAAGIFSAQVLNEPTHFLGIPPERYVWDFLAPAYEHLKEDDPAVLVVSAAEVGGVDGLRRQRAMFEAGLERHCDRVAYHVYQPSIVPRLAGMATRPVWITESGVEGPENHRDWVTGVFPEMAREIGAVERIFYYVLFDFQPNAFRLIDIVPDPQAGFRAVVESRELVAYFAERVERATADQAYASYRELIPDIRDYFPTTEDLRLIASTSFGRRLWAS